MGVKFPSSDPAEQEEEDAGNQEGQKAQDGDNGDRPMGKG